MAKRPGRCGLWAFPRVDSARGCRRSRHGARGRIISPHAPPRRCWQTSGVSIGLGTVANLEQATVQALAEPVAEARASVQAQPAAYLDETGWREGRQRAWLWTAVTAWVTVFVVRRSRRAKVAQELLGERCWGWLVTDRWSAYPWDPTWRRQVCWAHLRRDIAAMIERGGCSQEMGEALRAQVRLMFQWWHRVRAGTLAHTSVASSMWPIRRRWNGCWRRAKPVEARTAGTCREILKLRQALWTFVRHPEVEPTNHAAARAIRPGALAQRQLWHPESRRLPLCGNDDDGRGDASAATPERPSM